MFSYASSLVLLSLVASAFAKTDLAGCTSSVAGASILYYVPDSGEICSILDCGGGRAPPKTDVPGCAAYEGSAAYTPSFLPGFGPAATLTSTGPVPTTGLLTDTAIPKPASTLIPIASLSASASASAFGSASTMITGLLDTTATLGGTSATPSLVTSSLLFDTSAVGSSVSNAIAVTTTSLPSSVTSNAASDAKGGKEFMVVAVGAIAGLALL